MEAIKNFALAGGTALALQLGHRSSIDIDFFKPGSYKMTEAQRMFYIQHISDKLKGYEVSDKNEIAIFGYMAEIKIDLLHYPYPAIRPFQEVDGIRMFSMEDIAAMKLKVIGNRGSKKDFYDISALLKRFSLQEMIGFFKEKYSVDLETHYLKAMLWFEDAENDPMKRITPKATNETWKQVQQNVKTGVNKYLETYRK